MGNNLITFTPLYTEEEAPKGSLFSNEFHCEITTKLDELAGLDRMYPLTDDDSGFFNSYYRHYVLADKWSVDEKMLAVRIPGGTVGSIWYNDDHEITKINVDTNYVVRTYPKDVNETLAALYVGRKLDLKLPLSRFVK